MTKRTRRLERLRTRNNVLWRCEDCGGPANWTFINGEPYYLCHNDDCASQLDFMKSMVYNDQYGSVSALEAEAESEYAEQKIQE